MVSIARVVEKVTPGNGVDPVAEEGDVDVGDTEGAPEPDEDA